MASYPELRPQERSAKAGRSLVLPGRTPILVSLLLALLASALLAGSALVHLHGAKPLATPAFLDKELGTPAPAATAVHHRRRDFAPAIGRVGVSVRHNSASVMLASHDAGSGEL